MRIVVGVQTVLQAGMVGGDARRTGVLVALHGLDTAERKQKTPRRIDKIRAHAQATSPGFINLPEAITRIRSRKP